MSQIDGSQTIGTLAICHDGGREKVEESGEKQGNQKDADQRFGDGYSSALYSVFSQRSHGLISQSYSSFLAEFSGA